VSGSKYIVAPDNGLVSDVEREFGIEKCYSIETEILSKVRAHHPCGRTFLGRDVLAPVAAALAAGESVDTLGAPAGRHVRLDLPLVAVAAGTVTGHGRHVDRFGNILTDITGAHLKRAFGDSPLATIRAIINNKDEVEGVHEYFAQCGRGELMLILDSWNLVEIAVNQGSAWERYQSDTRVELGLERRQEV
jgi:S-adenosylmethionine hydrolase